MFLLTNGELRFILYMKAYSSVQLNDKEVI